MRNVDNWSLYFEEEHYNQIKILLRCIGRFNRGKGSLIDLRSKHDFYPRLLDDIKENIKSNKLIKDEIEHILTNLKLSFKTQLNGAIERENNYQQLVKNEQKEAESNKEFKSRYR